MKIKNQHTAKLHQEAYVYQTDYDLESDADVSSTVFRGQWDREGVYVYQAYNPEIADYALHHQRFGGPAWKPSRMTWIKPSFAWMMYRSGYGNKPGQTRVLKIKLSHDVVAYLLSNCKCVHNNQGTRKLPYLSGGNGRVQWDPERDLFELGESGKAALPRRMMRQRAIQIGLSGSLSEYYVNNILSIEDVTKLAHQVGFAHTQQKNNDVKDAMEALKPYLPIEQPYLPQLSESKLEELAMLPGLSAGGIVNQIGRRRHTKGPS